MPKMCPYNRAREVQRYKQKNELDESGNISSYAYEMRVDFIPLPCTGEECGAWRDGACRYASVNKKHPAEISRQAINGGKSHEQGR